MKILKQECVSADILIKELHKFNIEYLRINLLLVAHCTDDSIDKIQGANWHSQSMWQNVPFKKRIEICKLIEKALNKKL